MKELELEIGVSYQARSYESVRVNLRVALDEGEDSEKVSQELAKKVARIASNQNPSNYKDCMKLLGREFSEQEVDQMAAYVEQIKAQSKELKKEIKMEESTWESLNKALEYRRKLQQLMEIANCWSSFQNIVFSLAEANIPAQDLPGANSPFMSLPKSESTDDLDDDEGIPY